MTGPPLWYRRARRVGALRRGERGPGVAGAVDLFCWGGVGWGGVGWGGVG